MHIIIIGSGVAGFSFAEQYRSYSTNDELTVVTKENAGYYSRPLLSHGFSRANIEQTIILKTFDKLRANNINVFGDTEVIEINRSDNTITLSCQESILHYDKLIIATGSAAFIPPPFRPYSELFFCLNSLADLKGLRKIRNEMMTQNRQPAWAIIGGGLIGCEVASDLAVSGDIVTLFHAMDRLMERQLVSEDSTLLLEVLQNSGVTVLLNQSVKGFSKKEDKAFVLTDVTREFDALIVSCGFKPRIELAERSSLQVGRGIKVNQSLQTSDEAIYALGDVAELPNAQMYPYIIPIRHQAHWLASFLANQAADNWIPPNFVTKAKVHGFTATHPYCI
jgi:NAD(P)H-nitrite reductase large subunit